MKVGEWSNLRLRLPLALSHFKVAFLRTPHFHNIAFFVSTAPPVAGGELHYAQSRCAEQTQVAPNRLPAQGRKVGKVENIPGQPTEKHTGKAHKKERKRESRRKSLRGKVRGKHTWENRQKANKKVYVEKPPKKQTKKHTGRSQRTSLREKVRGKQTKKRETQSHTA